MDDLRRQQLQELITEMDRQASQLYARLFHLEMGSRCHAFLEHVGLIGEFVNVCRDELGSGRDFAAANGHGDEAVELGPHRLGYLREKLACIYGPGFPLKLALRTTAGKLSRVRAIELRAELEALYGSDVIERLTAANPGFKG